VRCGERGARDGAQCPRRELAVSVLTERRRRSERPRAVRRGRVVGCPRTRRLSGEAREVRLPSEAPAHRLCPSSVFFPRCLHRASTARK